MSSDDRVVVGIFIGGKGSRMGGASKGLLPAPASSATLLERLLTEVRAALPHAAVVLVGHGEGYAGLGLPLVADAPGVEGPLGGLLGLLRHGEQARYAVALALACDLPFIARELIARLAQEAPSATAVVTTQRGVRNPLCARYQTSAALVAAGSELAGERRSLQAVLDALGGGVASLVLSAAEEASLDDWDTLEDMQRPRER